MSIPYFGKRDYVAARLRSIAASIEEVVDPETHFRVELDIFMVDSRNDQFVEKANKRLSAIANQEFGAPPETEAPHE